MKILFKTYGKYLYYAAGIAILIGILYSTGIEKIYQTLLMTNFRFLLIGLGITIVASLLRVYKISLLLPKMNYQDVLEFFVFSRIGKELSFAGYFLPVAKKNNRNIDTVKSLLIDRYSEILSTVFLGILGLIFILRNTLLFQVLFLVLAGALLVLAAIPFLPVTIIKKYFRQPVVLKILELIISFQEESRIVKGRVYWIYLLSILSTILDFVGGYFLLCSINVFISFFYVPVVWAASGLFSIIGFMMIGTTEVSVIYLYSQLAGVASAVTASFIFVSRVINLCGIFVLFFFNILIQCFNRIFISKPKTL